MLFGYIILPAFHVVDWIKCSFKNNEQGSTNPNWWSCPHSHTSHETKENCVEPARNEDRKNIN